MTARDELIATLHSEGAYCGNCGFDGLALCSDCRTVLGRYADRLIGDGWVKMPSREALMAALATVLCNAFNYPTAVQPRVLGADLTALLDGTADAIVALLAGETS